MKDKVCEEKEDGRTVWEKSGGAVEERWRSGGDFCCKRENGW